MQNPWIGVNTPLVASETVAGEVIIVHHGTGHYFEATGSAAMIWQSIERGATAAELADMLVTCYAIAATDAHHTVEQFLVQLAEHGLTNIRDSARPDPATPAIPSSEAFAEPMLHVHSDLADLLLLDPIHDVDASGWPAPARAAATG